MHLYPAIDIRRGAVVRLLQGDFDQQTTYGQNPVEQAKAFEAAGASRLHIVDLDGARTGKMTNLDTVRAITRDTDLIVEFGGGVRSTNTIDALINAGVQRVVLGTAALKNWDWFERLMGNPTYRGKLVLGLDAREGRLAVAGWQEMTATTALDVARRVTDWPLAGIVYTDIATDGTLKGPSLDATGQLAEATDVPVIASGGVGTLDDLRSLRTLEPRGVAGVIVGRAIYDGRFSIEDALTIIET